MFFDFTTYKGAHCCYLLVQIAAWEAMDPDDRPQNFLPKKLVVVFIHSVLGQAVGIFSKCV